MAKMKKKKYNSYKRDGITYMECKRCSTEYTPVSDDMINAVTCSRCVILRTLALKPIEEFYPNLKLKSKKRKPPGWHFMAEFVDKDGTVYHRGVEQPDLKGSLKPTKVKVITKKKKKKKIDADVEMFKQAKMYKKKQAAKRKHEMAKK
jgi:hypothetical protein